MPAATAAPPAASTSGHRNARLLVLCGAAFLDSVDISMVSVALPSIGSGLGLSTSSLQWVLGGYALGYGAFLLLGGRATDLFGRRRVFLAALGVFAVASVLGAVAVDGAMLIAARFVTGLSAAFTTPAGLSIITTSFPAGPVRNRAVGIYTATAASGFSLGLVLGGLLTTIDWRLTFAVPAPIALGLLLGGRRLLDPDPAPSRVRGRSDVGGAATLAATMLVLVYAITAAPEQGWGAPRTLALLGLAGALAVAFVAVEHRAREPLLRLGFLRSPGVARANLVMATIGSFVAFQFIATVYLQDVLGWAALPTALAFLPGGLLIAAGAPAAGAVVTRLGPARALAAGMLAFAAGYVAFRQIGTEFTYPVAMLPTMVCLGVGFVLAFPAANVMGTSGVPAAEQGVAAGLITTSFQLGGALVLAVVSAVVAGHAGPSPDPVALVGALHVALAAIAVVAALGLVTALTGLPVGSRRSG